MTNGRIEQCADAFSVYHRPQTRFVADFIGLGTFLPGRVKSTAPVQIETELGLLTGEASSNPFVSDAMVHVFLRPDDVIHDDASLLTAKIVSRVFRGLYYLYTVRLNSNQTLECFAPSHHDHEIGSCIGIRAATDHLIVFP